MKRKDMFIKKMKDKYSQCFAKIPLISVIKQKYLAACVWICLFWRNEM